MSRESGVILLGGDMAQEMLKNYDLNVRMSDRNYVGTGYRGYAMNLHFQSAPDYIWTLAEAYMGLPKGSLDNVDAIAVSFDATATANGVDLGVKMVDAQDVRGILAQPLNIWGHEAFRKSYIIGNSNLTTDALVTLGFSADTRRYPIAPKDAEARLNEGGQDYIDVPVYGTDGGIVGYKRIASVPKPNGDNIQSGLKHVADITMGTTATAGTFTLTTETTGATIYYTKDGKDPASSTQSVASGGTVSLTNGQTLNAIAKVPGMISSNIYTYKYTTT